MGRVRRGGYILTWWKGDHLPPHVHVRTETGVRLGRLNLLTMEGMEDWKPDAKLVTIVRQLQREGRL